MSARKVSIRQVIRNALQRENATHTKLVIFSLNFTKFKIKTWFNSRQNAFFLRAAKPLILLNLAVPLCGIGLRAQLAGWYLQ